MLCCPFSETTPIKAIVKSVSKWVWLKDKDVEINFKLRQSKKGVKGGKASGVTRTNKNCNKKIAALLLYQDGVALTKIARELQISIRTLHKWKLEFLLVH